MSTPTILLADNDPDFLSICTEYLESAGYQVLGASSVDQARSILGFNHVHLAILDLRLTNDDNEKDRSGLVLAKEIARSIPKIILTKFPSHEDVREAMKMDQEAFPPAIDFVDKRKGLDELLASVRQAFSDYVQINWDLSIDWNAIELLGLVKHLDHGLKNDQVFQRAEELRDLLCGLFYDKGFIRLDRILWQNRDRIAIVIFAFKEGYKPDATLVVCGKNTLLNEEALRFETFAPKVSGKTSTLLIKRAETIHFSANCYVLTDNDLESIHTLHELYKIGPEKTFNAAITSLFQVALRDWHQEKPIHLINTPIVHLYREQLHITSDLLDADLVNERCLFIEHQALTVGIVIKRLGDKIRFHYTDQTHTYSNPIIFLGRGEFVPDLVINSSGALTGENIVVDNLGRTWLTDFIDAGQAPFMWNYVSLESSVRYDWLESTNFSRRHEMEVCLNGVEFAKPDIRDLDLALRKSVRAIQAIRKLAARHFGKDVAVYNQGVFLQGLKRFLEFDPRSPLIPSKLIRLIHILISISMIATSLEDTYTDPSESSSEDRAELRIDTTTKMILLGRRRMRLSPRPFKLILYLYENSNKVCAAEELRKNVVGENYSPTYIHTLIGRIREVIENDPENPHYLISEPNAGYRLVIHPE